MTGSAADGERAREQEPVRTVPIHRIGSHALHAGTDSVAVEEPLEICLAWPQPPTAARDQSVQYVSRTIAVTMRTPGHDVQLAAGFLFTEGVLQSSTQIAAIVSAAESANRVTVFLHAEPLQEVLQQLTRNFYVTSSCGVCGKASLDAIRTRALFPPAADGFRLRAERLLQLPAELEARQTVFRGTGSIHAAALFDTESLVSEVYEDVGRHNAVDKLLGAALLAQQMPLTKLGLLVSGRASFELVQKARMAGCAMLAAVGAPSSLAIDLAWDADMTLVGFLRDGRFNIYAGPARISGCQP